MRIQYLAPVFCVALAGMSAGEAFAGGRYTNPPVGLLEVQAACTQGLEAAQKGDKAAALEQAKKGRKIALDSYKEISTMPMEIGSSSMKKALAAIDADKLAEAIPEFEHCKKKMDDEVAYYKGEGKL
jgi:hypothetical protein